MSRRQMIWLGLGVCFANLMALANTILTGMYGLIAINLLGLTAGAAVTWSSITGRRWCDRP